MRTADQARQLPLSALTPRTVDARRSRVITQAHPKDGDEAETPALTTVDRYTSKGPHVSSSRRPLMTGRNAAIATVGIAGAVVAGTAAAALYVDANHLRPPAPSPVTQEGQYPYDSLKPTNPSATETKSWAPTAEIQDILKSRVNAFYDGTISLDGSTFNIIDPNHPNDQQAVDLSKVEELCGQSMPQDSHLGLELTNALISKNPDGTMTILMDGIVNRKRVILTVKWNQDKVVKKGLIINTKITGFTDGDAMVKDQNGNPQESNKLQVKIIDDQPNPAPVDAK